MGQIKNIKLHIVTDIKMQKMPETFGSRPLMCFEVEKIIGVSSDGNYQVQWAPAWVSKFHLVGCERLIQEFLQQQQQQQQLQQQPQPPPQQQPQRQLPKQQQQQPNTDDENPKQEHSHQNNRMKRKRTHNESSEKQEQQKTVFHEVYSDGLVGLFREGASTKSVDSVPIHNNNSNSTRQPFHKTDESTDDHTSLHEDTLESVDGNIVYVKIEDDGDAIQYDPSTESVERVDGSVP